MHPTVTQRCTGAVFAASILLIPLAAHGQTPAAAGADDPFARRGWNLEIGAHGAIETWNYNISHEDMLAVVTGVTYGLGKGVVLRTTWPLYYVWQRHTDAYVLGLTAGVRSRVLRRHRASLFWEFELGISEADTYVPPGGTRFNYLVLGGAGLTFTLRPGLHALTSLRWAHLSNNGLAGRQRNPDVEAVGPVLGVLLAF